MIIFANSSIYMLSLLTSSESLTISSISCSSILSPIVYIACLKSLMVIMPSWSESKTLSASTRSCRVSLSFPLSYTAFSRAFKVKCPWLLESTYSLIALISSSVGFKFSALTRVPSSLVATCPRLLLSNRAKISLISD